MARAYNSGRPQWPSTVREVVENIEPVNGKVVGYPTPAVGGPGAPSCYRVSLLSGSLEAKLGQTEPDATSPHEVIE